MTNYMNLRHLAMPLLLITDMAAFYSSIALAYVIRAFGLPYLFEGLTVTEKGFVYALWWLPLVGCLFFVFEKAYTRRSSFWQEAGQIVKTVTLVFLVSSSFVFLTKQGDANSRTLLLLIWVLCLFLAPSFRYLSKRLLFKAHIWEKPVIILGAGETGGLILDAFNRDIFMGYKPIGFLDDDLDKLEHPPKTQTGEFIPILGGFDDAEEVIEKSRVRDIIIAAPGLTGKKLVQLVNKLQCKSYNLMVVPDLFEMAVEGAEVQHLFAERTIVLKLKNNLNDSFNLAMKTVFDFTLSLILFILLIPILVLLALGVKLGSKGSVFYTDTRIGRKGKNFKCIKFRTMYPHADVILEEYLLANQDAKEQWEKYAKLKEYDPRVTKIGALLRRYSLDELPQILNVITGDMSLVGPRPYLPREQENLQGRQDILITKPGITGLWQISGRNDVDFSERMQLDLWYVRNWSLWLDISILMRTVAVVIKGHGAY